MIPSTENDKYLNFAIHPKTLSEIKAEKAGSSEPWTPRDALISVLRDIDQGNLTVSSLIVVFDTPKQPNDHRGSTFYVAAVKGFHRAIGILDRAKWLMHKD